MQEDPPRKVSVALARRIRRAQSTSDLKWAETRRPVYVTLWDNCVIEPLPKAGRSCYIRAMKKLVLAAFLLMLFAVPAFAAKHKVTHPKPVHAQNPYLKHPNHTMHRQHHKKI